MLTTALTEKMTQLRNLPNLPRWCLLGWVLGLASQANIALRLDDFALKLLTMQLAPNYEVFQGSLSTWTASDIAHYYEHLGFDLVHPIIYGVAISLNLAWSFRAAAQHVLHTSRYEKSWALAADGDRACGRYLSAVASGRRRVCE